MSSIATPVKAPSRETGLRGKGWHVYQAIRLALRWLRWWVRLEVRGLDVLPSRGPALIVSNHDSWLDPPAIAEAMMWRPRQVRFLAKASLWQIPLGGPVLDALGQIPVNRGTGDGAAIEAAEAALRRGETVGIFPEGTFSRGRRLRARRGVARLAQACPEAEIVLVAVSGSPVVNRFPRRPRVQLEFFRPSGGPARADESQAELAERLLDEIRRRVPPAA